MNAIESQPTMHPGVGRPEERLLIDDLIRYLSRLAALNKEDRTGNPELSDGLGQVARALRPHAALSIAEFADLVRGLSARPETSPRKEKVALPPNLESLAQPDVEEILDDDRFTKSRIIEVGAERFGIPKSKLARSCKQDAVESVRAALDHERSLDFIAAEAKRSGENRTS